MRPVRKGESPHIKISNYRDALPHLEGRIGSYCSYCELPLNNAPEVEHIISKSKNPEFQTMWANLLLACKYCNTRKSNQIDSDNVKDYLWPDQYNTALAFTYICGVPKINEVELQQLDNSEEILKRAKNTFALIKLGNKTDRRQRKRNEVFEIAKKALERWKQYPTEVMKMQIADTATACGFFSIWTTVFSQEPDMLKAFIQAFTGTETFFSMKKVNQNY